MLMPPMTFARSMAISSPNASCSESFDGTVSDRLFDPSLLSPSRALPLSFLSVLDGQKSRMPASASSLSMNASMRRT